LATTEQATAKLSGLRGDRARAIAWLAAFNAVNAIEPRYREYAPAPPPVAAGPPALGRCGLAAAIYTALALETDADQALLLRRYRESLAAVKSAAERDAGATLGSRRRDAAACARRRPDRRVEPPPVTPGRGLSPRPRTRAMPRSDRIIGIAPFAVRSVTAFDPGRRGRGQRRRFARHRRGADARQQYRQHAQRRADGGGAVLELGEPSDSAAWSGRCSRRASSTRSTSSASSPSMR
jgi:hypothetical protein